MTSAHNSLFVIECVPKNDEVNEGLVLSEFVKMTMPDRIDMARFSTKNEMISFLDSFKKDFGKYIHLSGHGSDDHQYFMMPKGMLLPEEFPDNCFKNRTVALSACGLGRSEFINRFMNQTGASCVIAPMNEVFFIDASVWFINFYYNVLDKDMNVRGALDKVNHDLGRCVKGGFALWE